MRRATALRRTAPSSQANTNLDLRTRPGTTTTTQEGLYGASTLKAENKPFLSDQEK